MAFPDYTYDIFEDFEDGTLSSGLTESDSQGIMTLSQSTQYHDGAAGMSVNLNSVTTSPYILFDGSSYNAVRLGFWYRTGANYANFLGMEGLFSVASAGSWEMTIGEGKDAGSNNRQISLRIVGTTIVNVSCADSTWYWFAVNYNRNSTSYIRVYNAEGELLDDVSGSVNDATPAYINLGGSTPFGFITQSGATVYYDSYVIDHTSSATADPLLGWEIPTSSSIVPMILAMNHFNGGM